MRGGGLSERKKVKSFRACFLCKTKELCFVQNAREHSNFQGVICNSSSGFDLTPYSRVIFGGSYFNSKTSEFKELFFRSKNDPRYRGVKIIPKKELSSS